MGLFKSDLYRSLALGFVVGAIIVFSTLGIDAGKISTPDGYTLMMATAATHAGNPNLMKSLPYDSLVDFAPAGFYGFIQFVLLVRADSGLDTLADLVKRAKARPPLTSLAITTPASCATAEPDSAAKPAAIANGNNFLWNM